LDSDAKHPNPFKELQEGFSMSKEKITVKVVYDLSGNHNVGRPAVWFYCGSRENYVVFEKTGELLWQSSRSAVFVSVFGLRPISNTEGPGAVSELAMQRIVIAAMGSSSCGTRFVAGNHNAECLI
jgi:hypothetical protein